MLRNTESCYRHIMMCDTAVNVVYPLTDANYHKVNKRSLSFAPVID